MPETPKDPMQAVAFARITATELTRDAREQAEACRQGAATLTELTNMLIQMNCLLRDANIADPICKCIANIADGAYAISVTVQHASERLLAHAEGWAREEQVWKTIMDQTTPTPEVKP
jgi:hypothetical protein